MQIILEATIKKILFSWVVVAHAFNLSTWEAKAGRSLLVQVSLVYRVSSRTATAVTQRNRVSKNQKENCSWVYRMRNINESW